MTDVSANGAVGLSWRLVLVGVAGLWTGCFGFPGTEGERCNAKGLCGSGLACDPQTSHCVSPAEVAARFCANAECGLVLGVDCGACGASNEACIENRCVDPCEGGRRCGEVHGMECGACTGATEVCRDGTCVDVCAGAECGEVAGKSCGRCGRTSICRSNACVYVCGGRCGEVQGVNCGGCAVPTWRCEANVCVDVCRRAGAECGEVDGVSCGTCNGAGRQCASNRCVDVCAGKNCGVVQGVSCGTCEGATELCESNVCVDVCAGKDCGAVQGVSCGTCVGATERCESNVCVDVCRRAGAECGEVQGVSCGPCGANLVCEATRCVTPWGGPVDQGLYLRIFSGVFTIGSPPWEEGHQSEGRAETQHTVTLTRDFWLKQTEVTQREWRTLMGSNPSRFTSCGDDCPVERVSWFDAADYANALSRLAGLPECYAGTERSFAGLSCRGFRLPSEAEWEYAARAGSTGSRYADVDLIAWHVGNSGGSTHPVRGKRANAWGLYDMFGNVKEWTQDWWAPYDTNPQVDPVGPAAALPSLPFRMFRNCGYTSDAAAYCRAASRGGIGPSVADYSLGFRLARTADP